MKGQAVRSLPEVRALDRDLGVDLALIMTFKCLKPREDAGYPAPRVGGEGPWASLVAQLVKNTPAMQETWVQSLDWEDPLEEGMATHSGILVWRIPWTEEPRELQSMRSQRVGHD